MINPSTGYTSMSKCQKRFILFLNSSRVVHDSNIWYGETGEWMISSRESVGWKTKVIQLIKLEAFQNYWSESKEWGAIENWEDGDKQENSNSRSVYWDKT